MLQIMYPNLRQTDILPNKAPGAFSILRISLPLYTDTRVGCFPLHASHLDTCFITNQLEQVKSCYQTHKAFMIVPSKEQNWLLVNDVYDLRDFRI
jgi:hypothetical protein